MIKDLTVGKPSGVLTKFCLPLFGSMIFQQLYNIADSFVAGKFISQDALAAVGNAYEITLIFIAFAFGCNIGCSVIVSQYFGMKKYKELKTTVSTTWIASGVLCILLMAIGWIFCIPLLKLINTPSDVIGMSRLYLNIYIGSLPFVFFYNVSTGIFSALGNSKTPFVFLAVSSISNIAVDILFVTVFNMGVAGVAWATFICQGVSCVASVIIVRLNLRQINHEGKAPLFSWHIFKRIAIIAVPSILQQSFISVGNIIIQGIINSFGTAVMAGYSAAIKLNNLVITSFATLGTGISNYAAQNIGAKKYPRVRQGYKASLMLVFYISVPIIILYMLFNRQFVCVFMNNASTAQAIDSGAMFLKIVVPFYFIAAMKIVSDGILRGGGHMAMFMFTTFTDLILRVVLAMILSKFFGSTGIWEAWPVGWVIGAIISVSLCCFVLKKDEKKSSQ